MQNSSNDRPGQMQRFMQITDSHCGAATVQMLLSNLGVLVSQEEIVEAAGVEHTIEDYGMQVAQMATAVRRLAPQAQFWYKESAEIEDLSTLVNQHGYPVGVEWQGTFGQDDDEDEDDDDSGEHDYGHYSIVTRIDIEEDVIVMVDPYRDFSLKDRFFSVEEFLPRWWDVNEVFDIAERYSHLEEDYHMLFVVVPQGSSFPRLMGMQTA